MERAIEQMVAGLDRPLRSSQQDVRLYYKRILPLPPESAADLDKAS